MRTLCAVGGHVVASVLRPAREMTAVWHSHVAVFELYSETELAKSSFPSRRNMLQHELLDLYGQHNADAATLAVDAEQMRSCTTLAQVRACVMPHRGEGAVRPCPQVLSRCLAVDGVSARVY